MPDIAKSDISPNLDRDKMFNELWWLNYCFCEGVGIGAVGNPFFGGEAVNICLHSKCTLAAFRRSTSFFMFCLIKAAFALPIFRKQDILLHVLILANTTFYFGCLIIRAV